jgi:predicted kinase
MADPAPPHPLLVIVSGPPATGKTTLSRRLADALGLFLLGKDDLKEMLGDSLPPATVQESQALGRASFNLLYHLAGRLLDQGTGLVIEGNFYRSRSEAGVRPLLTKANPFLVQCRADRLVAEQRYRDRQSTGPRHPVHFDLERMEDRRSFSEADWLNMYEPLDLGIPVLTIDTTFQFVDDLTEIVSFIQA